MKATCLFLVGLHFLRGSGLPVFPLDQPLAEHALNASIAHVNAQSRGPNLYGITRSFVRNVIPTGQDSYNMILNFGIQETICPQNSGKDPDECDFKTGHFVVSSSCSSRVQFAGDRIQGLSVQCDSSTSSSSESDSSEEMVYVFMQPNGRNPAGGPDPIVSPNPTQDDTVTTHVQSGQRNESSIYLTNLLE